LRGSGVLRLKLLEWSSGLSVLSMRSGLIALSVESVG
jgi:hypothetical protein